MRRSLSFAPLFAAFLLTFATASCDDAGNIADTDGGPFSNIHTDGGSAGGAAGTSSPKDAGAGGGGGAGPTDAKVDAPAGSGGTSTPTDAGAGDTKPATGSGGTSGSATGSGGAAGGLGATGSGGTTVSCMDCETANCNKGVTKSAYAGCYNPVDDQGQPATAAGGPMAGALKSDLCKAVLTCVRQNMCEIQCDANALMGKDANGNPLDGGPMCLGPMTSSGSTEVPGDIIDNCYCGQGVDATMCSLTAGIQTGPCKDVFEAAAEVSSPQSAPMDVGTVSDDVSYALGAATRLLERCDWSVCRGPCFGLPDLPGGSGGSGTATNGSGGAAGASAGAGGGTGSGAGGSGDTASGGSTVTYYQCTACESMQSGGCKVPLRNCSTATGTAAAGPGAGMNKSDLCMAVVTCARQTGCAEPDGDVSKCYCGPDLMTQEDGDCYSKGLGTGACRAQIEAASETTSPQDISMRLENADPSNPEPYVMGFATALIDCDIAKCDSTCSVGDPPGYTPSGGSTGASGSGGTTGTASGGTVGAGSGGDPGSGGVIGSGGVTASGGIVGSGGVVASGGVTASGGIVGGGGNSLVANPDFATSGASWTAEFSMLATWTGAKDGNDDAASGALGVTNVIVADVDGTTIGGARQCVPVSGGIALTTSTQIFVPSGQGSSSAAGVEIDFFPSTDCSGTLAGQYTSSLVTDTDTWKTVQGATATPPSAQSMAVRLVISKLFRSMAFDAYFDNVIVTGP